MKPLTAVSLFSGCMGLDLGMERAGIRIVASVEKDLVCQKTISLNRPDIPIFDDVFSVKGKDLVARAGGRIDIVIGGPPCQSFSNIGKRGSMEDMRGQALLHYIRLIREIHPRYFVMENVQGILTAERNGKPLMPWILKQFMKMGYNVGHWLLNSNDFGAPQKRLRVIILGNLDGPVHKPDTVLRRPLLKEAIQDLNEPDPKECAKFSPKVAHFLSKIPSGGDWRSLPKPDQDIIMGKTDRTSGGHTSFLRRLSYDRPSPTLVTSPTQRATTLCHPEHTRPLSVAEYRRIQGFPDDWKLSGSVSQKYRQLGNAVPVALAQAIGMALTCTSNKG